MERQVARQFFISRIVEQAAYEGAPLSALEKKYLKYDLFQSDDEADAFEEEFAKNYDPDEFVDRVPAMLERALKRELEMNQHARREYKEAWDTLKKTGNDESLVSFVDDAFGSDIRFRAPFTWLSR